jgi:hypothetical protein
MEKIMSIIDLFAQNPHRDWVNSVGKLLEAVEDNPCECLVHSAEDGDSAIVVAIAVVALIL